MRGRGASMLVRAARGSLLSGMQRPYSMSASAAQNLPVNPAFGNTPSRSLHSVSWAGALCNDLSRPWSRLVHHMSTAAASQPTEPETESHKKVKAEIHQNEKPATSPSDHEDENPALTKSNYWGLVPKKLYKEDGTPWRWTCFSVKISLPSGVNACQILT